MTSEAELYVYIMVDAALPPAKLAQLQRLQALRAFHLEIMPVDASQFANIRTTPGISIATYYRLLAHTLLPASVTRLLYLDSDLIIKRCISSLFFEDLEGAFFAGVNDSIHYDYATKFGTPQDAPHINAGVVLMDLARLRSSRFSERVDGYIAKKRYLITLGDQQILNGEFYNEIKLVDVRWNVHGSMFDKAWRKKFAGVKNAYSLRQLEQAVSAPWIIHYTYKRKPWLAPDHPMAHEWTQQAAAIAALPPVRADRATAIGRSSAVGSRA